MDELFRQNTYVIWFPSLLLPTLRWFAKKYRFQSITKGHRMSRDFSQVPRQYGVLIKRRLAICMSSNEEMIPI